MQTSLFYTAKEVQDMLGVSRGKAYQVVRELNMQLQEMGFIIVPGKIPRHYRLWGGLNERMWFFACKKYGEGAGKWEVFVYVSDYTGRKKLKHKRGFKTRREAVAWGGQFKLRQ